MASLQGIIEAIDRLSEKMGTPEKAAEAMRPSPVIEPYLRPGQPLPITAEAIGVSVAKHVAQITIFKDMGRHFATIAEAMKRTGPQSIPQQVLPVAQPMPGTIPLPATRRLGGPPPAQGGIDLSRLLSGAFGGVPIMGMMVRQYGILKGLMGEVRASTVTSSSPTAPPKYLAAGYRRFRDALEVSPVAESAMKAIDKFGPGAIGKRLAKDWASLTNIASRKDFATMRYGPGSAGEAAAFAAIDKAAAGAAIDFALVGGSVVAVGAAVVGFGKAISNANRAISGYSGQMAMAYAMSDVRDIFRDMASAQRRAPTEAKFLGAFGDFKDASRPILDAFLNAIEDAATSILHIVNPIVNIVGILVGLEDKIPAWMKPAGFMAPGLKTLGDLSEWAFGGPKTTGIDTTRPSLNSNSDLQKYLGRMIEAMDKNTEELRKANGGVGDMSAARFMAGVATAVLPGFGRQAGPGLQGGNVVGRHHAAVARMNYGHQGGLSVKDRSHVRGAAGAAPGHKMANPDDVAAAKAHEEAGF